MPNKKGDEFLMSKEQHDREMLLDDDLKPTATELVEDQVYRYEMLKLLERIAKALEKPYQVRFEY